MTITHINPDTMHKNPVFSQGMLVEGGKTLYVGEQNGVDANGAIVAGGAKAQAGEAWGDHPTAITVLRVHAMGRQDAVVGIEVIASV